MLAGLAIPLSTLWLFVALYRVTTRPQAHRKSYEEALELHAWLREETTAYGPKKDIRELERGWLLDMTTYVVEVCDRRTWSLRGIRFILRTTSEMEYFKLKEHQKRERRLAQKAEEYHWLDFKQLLPLPAPKRLVLKNFSPWAWSDYQTARKREWSVRGFVEKANNAAIEAHVRDYEREHRKPSYECDARTNWDEDRRREALEKISRG